MFWTIVIIAAVVFGGVYLAAATGVINPNAKIELFWTSVAEQSGLEYRKSAFQYTVTGVVDGYEIECDTARYGLEKGGPPYRRVQIRTRLPADLKMSTRDVEMAKGIFRSLTTKQIDLGNLEFDERVKIYAEESSGVAASVFHPGFQKLLLELLKNERVHYLLDDGVLSVITLKQPKDGKSLQPETVAQMVKDGLRVARSMEQFQ